MVLHYQENTELKKDVTFSSENKTNTTVEDRLGDGIQKAIELDKKLYKNRYNLSKSDNNIIPNVNEKT